MTDSLRDILTNKWQEPPEIAQVKKYVKTNFDEDVSVSVSSGQIIINVAGSALAAALRMEIHNLQKLLKTDKKLVIRIGH